MLHEVLFGAQAAAQVVRQVVAFGREGGDLEQGRTEIGAAHAQFAMVVGDQARIDVMQDGGEPARLLDHRLGAVADDLSRLVERARTVGSAAPRHAPRVALDDREMRHGQLEFAREDLRVGGLVALAVAVRADAKLDRLVGAHAHFAVFVGRPARHLDVVGEPDPAQPAVPPRGRAPLLEAVPAGLVLRDRHRARIVAAVVDRARGRAVGILAGLNGIAPAQLDAVDPHLGCRDVQQPLDQVDGLRLPGAAIGRNGRGVGEGHLDQRMQGRNPVIAGLHARSGGDRHQRAA